MIYRLILALTLSFTFSTTASAEVCKYLPNGDVLGISGQWMGPDSLKNRDLHGVKPKTGRCSDKVMCFGMVQCCDRDCTQAGAKVTKVQPVYCLAEGDNCGLAPECMEQANTVRTLKDQAEYDSEGASFRGRLTGHSKIEAAPFGSRCGTVNRGDGANLCAEFCRQRCEKVMNLSRDGRTEISNAIATCIKNADQGCGYNRR